MPRHNLNHWWPQGITKPQWVNSLWPSDAICRHRYGSTLVQPQVMVCCLMAPNHYLNQIWLVISKVLWHSSESNLTMCAQANILYLSPWMLVLSLKIIMFTAKSPRGQWVNLLWPSDIIWWHRFGSILAQVMACCLTAPGHYLNQCWLIISMVQWHSYEGSFTRDTSAIDHQNQLENYSSNIYFESPRGQWVNSPYIVQPINIMCETSHTTGNKVKEIFSETKTTNTNKTAYCHPIGILNTNIDKINKYFPRLLELPNCD